MICDPTGPQVCQEECGTWDASACECYNIPAYCRGEQCSEHHRWECENDGGWWNDDWCYCEYIWEDGFGGLQSRLPPHKKGLRSERLGHVAPRVSSCEEANRTPTDVVMDWGPLQIHQGEPIIAPNGQVMAPWAWGVSRPLQWAVLDQNGELMTEDGLWATEYVETLSAHPWKGPQYFTISVPVTGGLFSDIYAMYHEAPPGPVRFDYALRQQRIVISKNGHNYEVLTHCVKLTHNDIILTGCGQ